MIRCGTLQEFLGCRRGLAQISPHRRVVRVREEWRTVPPEIADRIRAGNSIRVFEKLDRFVRHRHIVADRIPDFALADLAQHHDWPPLPVGFRRHPKE